MAYLQRTPRAFIAQRTSMQRLVVLGLTMLLVGVFAPSVSGQSEKFEREDIVLEGSHTDMQFLSGRSVRIKATVADDVFAAGRDVTFDSATVQNAIVAGYDVEQRGGAVADMIVAAANLRIGGSIGDDLVAAARSMRVSSDGTIGGDARLAAETIEVEGRIGGSMRAAARRITVSGEVSGKADLLAERIVIGSGAVIGGDLIYRSGAEPEIAEGATIGGEIRRLEMDVADFRSIGFRILGIGLLIAISWAVAMLLLVVVVQLAFPNLMAAAGAHLLAHPWSNLGRGVAGLLLAAVLAGLLFASIVGIPLGAALGITIAIVSLLGLVAVSQSIGLLIRRWRHGPAAPKVAGRIGWAVAGAFILGVTALIPFVGGIVAGLAIAAGFGTTAAELWKRLRTA